MNLQIYFTEVFIMKKGLTEMVFILDRSGSMCGLEKDTIGGFNSLIEKQKKEDGEAFVSTILFDDRTEVLHDRITLSKVEPLSDKQYFVRGSTALLDAVGGAINHIGNIHKYAKEEDVPEHTIFIITTDGMENASRKYTREQLKRMILHNQEKYGWEFMFLGANIDAITTAEAYGIPEYMTANYNADEKGTKVIYEAMCKRVSMSRKNLAKKNRDWAKNIDSDYQSRSK